MTTALRSMNQQLLNEIVLSGQITKNRIQIKLNGDLLSDRLGHPAADLNPELLEWDAPLSFRRRGVELKIIAGDPVSAPDQTLIQAIRNAHKWAGALRGGTPLKTIASTQGCSAGYLARIIPLAGLSPKIQTAIVDGDQPASLTLETLVRGQVPLEWSVQERLFGFN